MGVGDNDITQEAQEWNDGHRRDQIHKLAFLEFLHITIAELRIRKHQANPTELTLTTLAPQSEEETQRRLEPDMLPRKGWYQQTCLTKLR